MYKETQNGVPSAMNPHCSEVRSSPSKLKVNRMHIAAPEALASSQIRSRYTRPEEGPGTPTGATPTLSVADTISVRRGARSANQVTGGLKPQPIASPEAGMCTNRAPQPVVSKAPPDFLLASGRSIGTLCSLAVRKRGRFRTVGFNRSRLGASFSPALDGLNKQQNYPENENRSRRRGPET